MRRQTKFAAGLAGGLALCVAATAVFMTLVFSPGPELRWVANLYAYKTRLANRIHKPKILLVGGSGVLFGLSARMIAARTGYPTVNFGTHAELGMQYHLYRVRKVVRPGDIVVLADEYGALAGARDKPSQLLVRYALARDHGFIASQGPLAYLHYLVSFDYLDAAYDFLWRQLLTKKGYTVRTLDRWGDETINTAANVTPDIRRRIKSMRAYRALDVQPGYAAWVLDGFVSDMRRKRVAVVATWPTVLRSASYRTADFKAYLATRENEFRRLHVPLLGTPGEAMLPLAEMFDTTAHPNTIGRARYTAAFADALCGIIACRRGHPQGELNTVQDGPLLPAADRHAKPVGAGPAVPREQIEAEGSGRN